MDEQGIEQFNALAELHVDRVVDFDARHWPPPGRLNANTIQGILSINGKDTIDTSTNTITFVSVSDVVPLGDFLTVLGATPTASMINQGNPVDYTTLDTAGSVYTATGNSATSTFTLNPGYAISHGPGAGFTISGDGVITLNGFDPTSGTLTITTQDVNNATATVTFSATTVSVPAPLAGAGMPGLIAACGGLLGWWRRKQKVQAFAA